MNRRALLIQQQGRPGRAGSEPVPVVTPSSRVPWDKVWLLTGGFSTPEEWGVPRERTHLGVVWHTMEGYLPGAMSWWNQGTAGAHICIQRDGTIWLTCELHNIPWHGGTSDDPSGPSYGRTPFWRRNNANPWTVGIELEGFAASGITEAQVQACIKVGRWLREKYNIPSERQFDTFAGHHAHGDISASRSDPGPHFPWDRILAGIAATRSRRSPKPRARTALQRGGD